MISFAAVAAVSMCLGAAGTYSMVRGDDAPQRELFVTRAEIRYEQATARLEEAVAALDELMPLYERGFVAESELDEHLQAIEEAKSTARRRELDLEETRLTGRSPNDDLAAPLVDGRDFVSERLRAQTETLRSETKRRKKIYAEAQALFERAFISAAEVDAERGRVAQAEAREALLAHRLELRRRFLAGELTAEEASLMDLAEQAGAAYADARQALEQSKRVLQRVESLAEGGAVTSSELREAEAAVRAAQARLRLAEIERRIVQSQLDEAEAAEETDRR
jgi:multidrug resistance efflux pump